MSDALLERDLQAKCVAWWNSAGLPGILFHVPNEGKRSRLEAASLRAMGVVAGVADLVLVLRGGRSVFIELKAEAGDLSPSQRDFRHNAIALGSAYFVIRSVEAFRLLVQSMVSAAA